MAVAWLAMVVGLSLQEAAVAQETPRLRIAADTASNTLLLELGPIDLPAGAGHDEITQPPAQRVAIPVSGWFRGFEVELVDAEGRAVPRVLLHHVNVIAPGQRELFSEIMLRVAAAGSETAPIRLPRLIGVPFSAGDTLLVTGMFHNPTPESYDGVMLRMRLPYIASDTWLRPISVFPFYVDVMPPAGGHAYDLPPGRSEKSWEGRPALSGRILGMGGHLHRYAVSIRFEDLTEGKVLWESRPILDDQGNVVGMPQDRFFWRLGLPIRADHTYRLTAVYDNPTGETIPLGAMGTLGGVFLPARGAAWPAARPDHPEYRLDVKAVTEGAYGDGRHGGHGEHGGHGAHGGRGGQGERGDRGGHDGHGGQGVRRR